MRAVVITKPGGPDVLRLADVDTPRAQRDEVRVKVQACGVNRVDLLQRAGLYPAPPGIVQDIPGVEYAGIVDELGEGVTSFAPGDKVFGIAAGGTYAEFLVVHSRTLMHMPRNLSFTEAACVPEVFITAYDAMVERAGLKSGETVLIHAVGSGVGTAAVQLAKLINARVIGTARSSYKLEKAREIGLKESVMVQNAQFAREVLEMTLNQGVDVVLELVGGNYVSEDIACMTKCARLVLVGLVGGAHAPIDLGQVLKKRLAIFGTTLRARPLEEKISATRLFANHVLPFFETNQLQPVIDKVFPLAQAAEAHAYVATNKNFGKVVLQV